MPRMRCMLLLVLLVAGGCGPSCPKLRAWRADLPAPHIASGQRLVFQANVIGQVNRSPPTLVARIERATPRPVDMSVLDEHGARLFAIDATPEPDGTYWLRLRTPDGAPLAPGVYRLRAELPEPVEAMFEVRHCVVYY
jgi:hypothetical protein